MQKRSLYTALIAAVVGIAGAIVALSRRRPAPVSEMAAQISLPLPVEEVIISQEQPVVKESLQPTILVLLASGLGVGCLVAAQTLLLNSRNPILPLILFITGVILLQPMLSQVKYLKIPILEGQAQMASIIMVLAGVALLLSILAPPPLNPLSGQFQMLNALIAMLVVPAVYLMGETYEGSRVGLIAAGFAAVSGWTLALSKAESEYISLVIISAVSLAALERIRRRQGKVIYAIFLALFLGAIIVLTRVMAPSVLSDVSILEQIPANPQLSPGEGLFTSLLMFNLTSDPNPLHGIVDRPVFSPILSALFVFGLLILAWRIDAHRRWSDVFLLTALVITLIPSAYQLSLPVRYPDLRRAAMALPVALVIAALGASSLAHAVIARLGRMGLAVSVILFIAALVIIAIDAQQHYTHIFLPIYDQGVFISRLD